MSNKAYRRFFVDYQQGYLCAFGIFNHALQQKLDPTLSAGDDLKLQACINQALKGQPVATLLAHQSKKNKGLILSFLARQLQQAVCVVDCKLLQNEYIGETEKNLARIIADASTHNWVLLFDEADALFNKHTKLALNREQDSHQAISYLFKLLSQHQGLSLLACDEPRLCDILRVRCDYYLLAKP